MDVPCPAEDPLIQTSLVFWSQLLRNAEEKIKVEGRETPAVCIPLTLMYRRQQQELNFSPDIDMETRLLSNWTDPRKSNIYYPFLKSRIGNENTLSVCYGFIYGPLDSRPSRHTAVLQLDVVLQTWTFLGLWPFYSVSILDLLLSEIYINYVLYRER